MSSASFLMPRIAIAVLMLTAWPAYSSAAIVAQDNFESGGLSGGTGWSSGWNVSGGIGGSFVSFYDPGVIEGNYALGMYRNNNNAGVMTATRMVAPTLSTAGTTVTFSLSFRANWDVVNPTSGTGGANSEIGLNILRGDGQTLFTMKFVQGNSSFRVNDGGGDFSTGNLVFAKDDVYDLTFTTVIGATSNKYSFSATRHGTNTESSSGMNFTFSAGRVANAIGGIQFFANPQNSVGSDAFFDGVQVSAVPEASPFLFVGLTFSMATLLRRRGLLVNRFTSRADDR